MTTDPATEMPPPDDPVLVILGLTIQVRGGQLTDREARRVAVSPELASKATPAGTERIVELLPLLPGPEGVDELLFAQLVGLHALALEHRGADALALRLYSAILPVITRLGTAAEIGTIRKNRAGLLGWAGDPAARREFVEALAILREHGTRDELALGLVNWANFLHRRWELAESVRGYDEALPLLREHGTPDQVGFCLMNRAITLDMSERPAEALTAFDEALTYLREHGTPADVALCTMNRADVLRKTGRYEEARTALEAALPPLRDSQLQKYHGLCMMNLGNTAQGRGDVRTAVDWYDRAVPVLRAADPGQVPLCLVNRSLALQELGRHAEALAGYDEALPVMRAAAPPVELGQLLLNRAITLRSQGSTHEAIAGFEEARPLLREHPLRENYGLCLMALGEALLDTGRLEEIEALYREALPVLERHSTPGHHAVCLLSWGNALCALDRHVEALDVYAAALPLLGAHGLRTRYAHCLMNRGVARTVLGHIETALEDFDGAVRVLAEIAAGEERARPDLFVDTLINRAVAYRRLDRFADATADYTRARGLLRAARRTSRADDTTLDLHGEYATLFRGAVHAALNGGMIDAAYDAARDGKATVVDDLRYALRRARASEPAAVRAARGELTAWMRANPDQTDAARGDALAREYLAAWGRHAHAYVSTAEAAQIETPPAREQVQAAIPPGWAVVDFWRTNQNCFHAFVLTRDQQDVIELPFPADALSSVLERLYESLREVTDAEPNMVGLDELGTHLFRPLLPVLERTGVRGLYLIPHDALHLFPLHAARIGTEYLCDRFDVAYLPSANLLHWLPAPDPSGGAFVLANPEVGTPRELPFAHWEGVQLRDRLGVAPDRCLLGAEGTYAATDRWAGCGLVHFSCHGHGSERFAPLSHLCLADDLLLAHDVLHRKPELKPGAVVVLNGCQTGVADRRAIDESMGLMTAFLLRGAGVVFSTQWSVYDVCAAPLVVTFADRLRAGGTPAEAMRAARDELRGMSRVRIRELVGAARAVADAVENQPPLHTRGRRDQLPRWLARERPFDHPVFWAAFQLVGRAE